MKLEKPGRQLLMKGRMRHKANSLFDATDLQVFLFDHYLLFAKIKYELHLEWYKVFRKVSAYIPNHNCTKLLL